VWLLADSPEAFYQCQRLIRVICPERERLNRAYLDATAKVQESGSGIADAKSAKWKEATRQTRAASKAALEAFKRRRQEHGC
jgi:hypothetical protein